MNSGRRYLVTGSASGIGLETTRRLVDAGNEVVAADNSEKGLQELSTDIPAIETLHMDLTDYELVDDLLSTERFDGVANVAGVGPDADNSERILEVNHIAPLNLMKVLIPNMRDGGSVVNVASIAGNSVSEDLDEYLVNTTADDRKVLLERIDSSAVAYAYSKRGQILVSRQLAIAWGPNIRINSISPGIIDTPLLASIRNDPWVTKVLERTPAMRPAIPEEVAPLIAFLLGPDSEYITGVNIPIDGGYLATKPMR